MGNSQQSQGGVNPGSAIDFINSADSVGNSHMEEETNTKGTRNSQNNQDVMTTFTWTLGGNTVFLTGTFTNWSNHIPLQKDGHIFTRTIPLERTIHHYKFIVDGDWRFSPEDPTTTDEKGNINNTVDLTNYKALSNNAMKNGSQDISYEASRIIESKKDKPLVSFEQFNETAPKLPSLFTSCPYLDSKDSFVKSKKQSKILRKPSMEVESTAHSYGKTVSLDHLSKDDLIDIFDSTHSLNPPTHVVLNHLAVRKNNKNFNVYSMTHRFKSKYTTYKFFIKQKKGFNQL